MFCCVNCFTDLEIKSIIDSYNNRGDCEFCGSKNVHVINTDELSNIFDELLSIYTPISEIDSLVPEESQLMLGQALNEQWDIFNLEPGKMQKLVTVICHERISNTPDIFDSPVTIQETLDPDYMIEHSFLNNVDWEDFANEIKFENRFHLINKVNLNILDNFFDYFKKIYKTGKKFYRARQTESISPFPKEKMGPPPLGKRTAGRANPRGISVLYLANDISTTIFESRARIYDYITIGTFELEDEIKVVSLRSLDKISPFLVADITEYAINKKSLSKVSYEISKPLRRHDSELDYLPTQYLTEYIKSKGYDGIEYNSTMRCGGYNLAIFNKGKFNCIDTELYEITSLNYNYKKIR